VGVEEYAESWVRTQLIRALPVCLLAALVSLVTLRITAHRPLRACAPPKPAPMWILAGQSRRSWRGDATDCIETIQREGLEYSIGARNLFWRRGLVVLVTSIVFGLDVEEIPQGWTVATLFSVFR
jgi:hypothetical protein